MIGLWGPVFMVKRGGLGIANAMAAEMRVTFVSCGEEENVQYCWRG